MTRSIRTALLASAACLATGCGLLRPAPGPRPNVVLIVADGLGRGELSCYGQRRIRTPHLDGLAREGMAFTQAYAGGCTATASQGVLLTGRDTRHASARGDEALPADAVTIAEVLRDCRYATAAFGTWRLGGASTTGHPTRQGFDTFYGALTAARGRDPYPDFLWRNATKVPLPGNSGGGREHFALDAVADRAVEYLEQQDKRRRFFLYVELPAPGGPLQVPADSLAQYKGRWAEADARGGDSWDRPLPRATHAARISRMDEHVGRLLAALRMRGLERDTLVLFTSTHGPSAADGADTAFFASAGALRGEAGSLYEGGLMVPLIARWPARIPPGVTSDLICAAQDVLPTLAEAAGAVPAADLDGVSFLPSLTDRPGDQRRHGSLYWEHGALQALRLHGWKAVRPDATGRIELYDLSTDAAERTDVAAQNVPVIREVELLLSGARGR